MSKAKPRFWVLGAPDPEMAEIEHVLTEAGETFSFAVMADGRRVHAGCANRADGIMGSPIPEGVELICVECRIEGREPDVIVDHHAPGDPGYGMPPERYMEGSSLGRVLSILGVEPTRVQRLIAAADHCLAAAYAGRCPGVYPEVLADFRAAQRAAFLTANPESPATKAILDFSGGSITSSAILKIYDQTAKAVRSAPVVDGLPGVYDLREIGTLPELPEALAIYRMGAIYRMLPQPGARDQRVKVGILGCGEGTALGTEPVQYFMEQWGPKQGLHGIYGDPVRGYAGGYEDNA